MCTLDLLRAYVQPDGSHHMIIIPSDWAENTSFNIFFITKVIIYFEHLTKPKS